MWKAEFDKKKCWQFPSECNMLKRSRVLDIEFEAKSGSSQINFWNDILLNQFICKDKFYNINKKVKDLIVSSIEVHF